MRTRTIAATAAALALAAPVAAASTAEAATPVQYRSFACHTTGAYASTDVHGTVKYGYRIVKGKVQPVSSRFVGTTRVSHPQPKGRTQVWTFANSSVSRDNGTAVHTSSANPVTFQAAYLPASANDTTVTGRWTLTVGGTRKATVPCTARISVAAPATAQQAGTKWTVAPRSTVQQVGTKWTQAPTVQLAGTKWTSAPTGKVYAV